MCTHPSSVLASQLFSLLVLCRADHSLCRADHSPPDFAETGYTETPRWHRCHLPRRIVVRRAQAE